MARAFALIAVLSFLAVCIPSSIAWAEEDQSIICQILVDWDEELQLEETGEIGYSIIHRYKVSFDPPFTNGTSPSSVVLSAQHLRNQMELAGNNTSSLIAGGEIDLIMPESPEFGDYVSISVQSDQAVCSRSLSITNWNQPISDHEITRETSWSVSGIEDNHQGISFEGRGWQKRSGSLLESNELGNGTLFLDLSNDSSGGLIDLDLDRIWLNETYDGIELISQEFEMSGLGNLTINTGDGGDGAQIDAWINDAYVFRSYKDGKVSERMRFQGDGWLSIDGGDNESSGGVYGEVFLLYFEIWDEDGFRRLQDLQVEANATARLSAVDEYFSFDLDELILREKWEEGARTDQYSRIYGSGHFDFVASEDSPYIEMNGTIPLLHFQSEDGETVADSIIVDGTYDGDAQGTFGLVRKIVESGVFQNATGEYFEADKIQNELWFNISATPFGPISQEWGAEHNLTYEYVVPQEDWSNRTIRYTYVNDNGTEEDEFPHNSPIIASVEPPEANPIFSDHISRETGVCPQLVSVGDKFSLIGNSAMILQVSVTETTSEMVDGHNITVAHWSGTFGDQSSANGSVINEGPLSGLLNEATRNVRIGMGEEQLSFIESQRVERILYPPIVTFDENTPPLLDTELVSPIRFREGILTSEGGVAHLEVVVNDVDTDTSSVSVDLNGIGLGIIELSDSGLMGDQVIHDDIWTARISHDGLQHGIIPVTVFMEDYWMTVQYESTVIVSNPPPRLLEIEYTPSETFRGDMVEIKVGVFDAHGIKSVSVNLLGMGGGISPLQLAGEYDWEWEFEGSSRIDTVESWFGVFEVPNSFAPGMQNIPILVEDNNGSSTSTTFTGSIVTSMPLVSADKLQISNQPPSISNITLVSGSIVVESVLIPLSGNGMNYSLEAAVQDIDGISSVQAKIGRLAPIGKSESWILMTDDGTGADRVAGDGVYSLYFTARSSLGEGEMSILIRATDVFQETTTAEDQAHSVIIVKSISGNSDANWVQENSTQIILGSLGILLFTSIIAFFIIVRNSEIE